MARWRAPGAAGSTRVRQPSPDLGRQGRKAWGELPTGGLGQEPGRHTARGPYPGVQVIGGQTECTLLGEAA